MKYLLIVAGLALYRWWAVRTARAAKLPHGRATSIQECIRKHLAREG